MQKTWVIRSGGLALLLLTAVGFVVGPILKDHLGAEPWLGLDPAEIFQFGMMVSSAVSLRLLMFGLPVRWRLGAVLAITVVVTLIVENWTWTSVETRQWNDLAAGYMVWFYVFPVAALALLLAAIPLGDGKTRQAPRQITA